MNTYLRQALRTGVVLGIVMLFIYLSGFAIIISTIIGDLLNLESSSTAGNYSGLMILIALLAAVTGAIAIRHKKPLTAGQVVVSGALAGLASGTIAAVFLIIIGAFRDNGIDVRNYLAQLSADTIDLYLLGRATIPGALFNLGLQVTAALAGAILAIIFQRIGLRDSFIEWRHTISVAYANSPLARFLGTRVGRIIGFGILLIIVLIIPLFAGQYWNFILGTVGIYVLMGLGLNIVVGLAGLLDLGYVAFFAVGAYTIGLLTAPEPLGLEWNFWIVLIIAVFMAALAGILLGIPVLRLRGDYLAIVTLGFGEIIRILVRSDLLAPVLGGPQGIRDIAGPTIFGRPLDSERAFMYLIILGILLVIFLTIRLQNSRVGRSWIAMREDETVAQAMGISTYQAKLLAFAIGAAFAGLGGVLFASRNQYTGPEDHSLLVSINVLSIVIVGGMGSIPGVILGAFALKGLPEILRQIEDYRILAFGGLLVVMMIWRPEGLWPSQRRRLEMHTEDDVIPPEPVSPKSTDAPVEGPTAEPITTSTNPEGEKS